jgi:uncharacterized protein YukE
VDTRAIARNLASDLIAHRNKLAGKAEDAVKVQFALHQTAQTVADQRDTLKKETATVLSHWNGDVSQRFDRRSDRLARQMRVTGAAAKEAETIVSNVTAALTGGHANAQRLVEEYVTKAAKALDAGVAVSGAGAPAALMKAVGNAADLLKPYLKESTANLRRVNAEMAEAAKKLRALEKDVEHDGIVDPGRTRPAGHGGKDGGKTKPAHGRAKEILSHARKEIGTRENPPGSNRNPYGPTAPWCSSFATAMWRKAGVKIPLYPFTGDVYTWGQEHGKAYGKGDLKEARPGDVLLFGTGPGSPSTSTHIGIVEKVDGNTVTLIEGNSGDRVQRNTHTLSSSTFYGGVHP